jgi:hypothetical protein
MFVPIAIGVVGPGLAITAKSANVAPRTPALTKRVNRLELRLIEAVLDAVFQVLRAVFGGRTEFLASFLEGLTHLTSPDTPLSWKFRRGV